MRAPHLLLLCVLGAALLSSVLCNNALGPANCCFNYKGTPLRRAVISSYQSTHPMCQNKAIIFTTMKGHKICVRPTLPWVELIVKKLDEKSL